MLRPSNLDFTFVGGFVVRKDLAYLLTDAELTDEDGSDVGLIEELAGGEWAHVVTPFLACVGIDAVGGTDPRRPSDFTVVGAEGDFLRAGSDRVRELGCIDTTSKGPSGRGSLRALRRVGEELYVVGGSRQAYARHAEGRWRRIDDGLVATLSEAAGLNDVDGFSGREIYAAGLRGEIWRYDGARWHTVVSATTAHLHAVRRGGDAIYVVGEGGVVLRGRGHEFEIVALAHDRADLVGAVWFRGALYACSRSALYRLEERELRLVDPRLGDTFTAGSLQACDEVLWSIGSQHVLTSVDGTAWSQLFV